MRLRYDGDPGRHYPDLGLLAYPGDVRELATDPGDERWREVDPETPLTERPAGEPLVDEPADEPAAEAAGGVVEPAGPVAAELGAGEQLLSAAAVDQAAGVVAPPIPDQASTGRGARKTKES